MSSGTERTQGKGQETKGKEEFWEKQRALTEKWKATWGSVTDEKKNEAPRLKLSQPRTPITFWCEGGFGTTCPNKADYHINCDAESLYYQQYICSACWKWNYLFGKPKEELPPGLRIFRIVEGVEELEAGSVREKKKL